MEEKQYIRTRVIIEVLGKPKEHVERALSRYIDKLKKEESLMLMKTDTAEPKLQKDEVWSAFSELEIVFKTLPELIGFCFEYMPSSVEISKPEKLVLNNHELAAVTNDLQARLHVVDMTVKKLHMENNFLKRNLKTALQNSILVLLKANNLSKEQISKYTGIASEEVENFIKELMDKGDIKKEGELYSTK